MRGLLPSAMLGTLVLTQPALSGDRPAVSAEITELTMMVGASDVDDRVMGAIALCYVLWGDYDGQEQFLQDMGYSHAFWGGLHQYDKDTTQILMSQGFFCDVSDWVRTQAQARDILQSVLDMDTTIAWAFSQSERGCPTWESDLGGIVVTSEGQDPICTPTEGSAIRFWMAGGE